MLAGLFSVAQSNAMQKWTGSPSWSTVHSEGKSCPSAAKRDWKLNLLTGARKIRSEIWCIDITMFGSTPKQLVNFLGKPSVNVQALWETGPEINKSNGANAPWCSAPYILVAPVECLQRWLLLNTATGPRSAWHKSTSRLLWPGFKW